MMDRPLMGLLLALADDDFILGYRDSEWTGIAPMLEEDIAMSSLSQDEIGHARVLYEMIASADRDVGIDDGSLVQDIDKLAYGRELAEYRSCWLVEHHRRDWAFTIARRYLYETADDVRADSLAGSWHAPLAAVMQKIRREERYHLLHLSTWLDRMTASEQARPRFLAAMDELWPDALGLFEELQDEGELVATGTMPAPSAELRRAWLDRIGPTLKTCGVPLPGPETMPRTGGRSGRRTHGFQTLWDEMTEVYRLDPQAAW